MPEREKKNSNAHFREKKKSDNVHVRERKKKVATYISERKKKNGNVHVREIANRKRGQYLRKALWLGLGLGLE